MGSLPRDHIVLNVGGRLFETTTTTLLSSDSKFFHGLLGPTGITLATGNRRSFDASKNTTTASSPPVETTTTKKMLFVDRDGDLFDDILYFMRNCQQQLRATTRADKRRLNDLQDEADFFCYDSLTSKCQEYLDILQREQPRASAHLIRVPCRSTPSPTATDTLGIHSSNAVTTMAALNAVPPQDDDNATAHRNVDDDDDGNGIGNDNDNDNDNGNNNDTNNNNNLNVVTTLAVNSTNAIITPKIEVPHGQCLYIVSARANFSPSSEQEPQPLLRPPPPPPQIEEPLQIPEQETVNLSSLQLPPDDGPALDLSSLQLPPDDGQAHFQSWAGSSQSFRSGMQSTHYDDGEEDDSDYDTVNLQIRICDTISTRDTIESDNDNDNDNGNDNVFTLHSAVRRRKRNDDPLSVDPVLRQQSLPTRRRYCQKQRDPIATSTCTTTMDHLPICLSSPFSSTLASAQQLTRGSKSVLDNNEDVYINKTSTTQEVEFFATSTSTTGADENIFFPAMQTSTCADKAWFEVHYWVGHPKAIPGLSPRGATVV